MAEAVIDDLEPVEIQKQYGKAGKRVAVGTLDRLPQMIHKLDTIRQLGQSVVKGVMPQPLFGAVAFGDIAKTAYAADRFVLDKLGLGVSFKDAAVEQLQYVSLDAQRIGKK